MELLPPYALLQQSPLLQSLSPDEIQVVAERFRFEEFSMGEDILSEGLVYQGLWLVLEGKCEVVKGSQGPRPNQLAILEPGALFGEMSFLTGQPHSATVRALTQVQTARLMQEDFAELEQTQLPIAHRITTSMASVLADRLRRMDEWVGQLVEKGNPGTQQGEWREFRSKLYAEWQL